MSITRAEPKDVAHAAVRGLVAAMAMTGMRRMTVGLGLVEQTPPQAIVRQRARALLRRVEPGHRDELIELLHWAYGAGGGAAFALLPDGLRRPPWTGIGYGIVVLLGFELGIAPALGLSQAKRKRPVERAALAADHVLYGLLLSEIRPAHKARRSELPDPG